MTSIGTLLAKRANPGKRLLRNVAIVGGTHGNELAGVHLVQHFLEKPGLVERPSFRTTCVLSNVEAIKADRRYVATDLNRGFDMEALEAARAAPNATRGCEQQRALELDALLGPKFSEEPAADMIFDLHNTTANCGVLLCFHRDDVFAREVAAYLHGIDPDICTVLWPQADPPFLPTIGRSGMTFEVGPVPHSTVNAAVFARTKALLLHALDYVEMHNQHVAAEALEAGTEANDATAAAAAAAAAATTSTTSTFQRKTVSLPVATRVTAVDYPRDAQGRLAAFIHPDLQGIAELRPSSTVAQGSSVFATLAGEDVLLDVEALPGAAGAGDGAPPLSKTERYFPLFVNEAAYYEKGTAFFLTTLANHDVRILAEKSSA